MAARWVGLTRPHNKKTAARIAVRRTFRDAIQDCVHALGVSGVLLMAAALNFAMYPDALANVVGEQAIIGFVPEDQSSSAATQQIAPIVVDETEVRLLAATVWGEARSESEDGMRAVAHVMVNRIGSRFGEDLATVILSPKQFSVWNRGDPNRRLVTSFVANPERYTSAGDPQWETAQQIAREVLSGQSVDPTEGALFYHTRSIRPRWSRQGVGRQTIGQHVFYADVPDAGVRDTPRAIEVAQYFGRGLRILNPTTRERVTGVIQTADAAATPTLNGVPITQINHGAAAAP
jgi:spore germination cell wall hydrolase CwlJ-like protein